MMGANFLQGGRQLINLTVERQDQVRGHRGRQPLPIQVGSNGGESGVWLSKEKRSRVKWGDRRKTSLISSG